MNEKRKILRSIVEGWKETFEYLDANVMLTCVCLGIRVGERTGSGSCRLFHESSTTSRLQTSFYFWKIWEQALKIW